MNTKYLFSVILFVFSLIVANQLNEKIISKHLDGFKIFLDKKFIGEFYNSTKQKPLIDIIHFERILNGTAISISHSINHGEYGGKSIIMWNSKTEKLESYYFSTGGEILYSKVTTDNGQIIMVEDFSNNNNGIQKVKKIYRIKENNKLENQIKYFMNNIWVNSHEMTYSESDSVDVIFK